MEVGKFDKAAFEAAKNRGQCPAPKNTDAVQAALSINWRLTPVEKRTSETKAARALARN